MRRPSDYVDVFPTRVGVDRPVSAFSASPDAVFPTRVGVDRHSVGIESDMAFSPHAWGWTV